jgi:hypothetical protein
MVDCLRHHKGPVCIHAQIHHGCRLGNPDNYVESPQYDLIEMSWELMGANMTYNAEGMAGNTCQLELFAQQ